MCVEGVEERKESVTSDVLTAVAGSIVGTRKSPGRQTMGDP